MVATAADSSLNLLTAPSSSMNSFAYRCRVLDERVSTLGAHLEELWTKLTKVGQVYRGMALVLEESRKKFERMDQAVEEAYLYTVRMRVVVFWCSVFLTVRPLANISFPCAEVFFPHS